MSADGPRFGSPPTPISYFGHGNIIRYCNRPFTGAKEHDLELISRWNSKVKPNDTVYHLGDFGFGRPAFLEDIRNRLNGKIHMIWGNHDKRRTKLVHLFESTQDYLELTLQDKELDTNRAFIVLFHNPILTWNRKHYGSVHLHGHCHGHSQHKDAARIDVGVDCFDYYPISYLDLKIRLTEQLMQRGL